VDGKKKHELRLNDFGVEPRDTLVLEEWTSADLKDRHATEILFKKSYLFKKV